MIRTTPDRIERYALRIIGAEVTTFCRHSQRNMEAKAKTGSKFAKLMLGVTGLPGRLVGGGKRKANRNTAPVAPPLPDNVEYLREIDMKVSSASKTGAVMRLFWGAHNLFEGSQSRVDVEKYQPKPLKPFPQAKPNLATRAKKAVLFSRPVIWLMRKVLVPRYAPVQGLRSEQDVYNMLRTHSEQQPNKYNLVVLKQKKNGQIITTIILARITSGAKLLDWILSKHVLMAAYSAFTFFAGEIWKDEHGVIHYNRNSGTFQPSAEQAEEMQGFFQEVFPHLTVVNEPI